MTARKKTQCPYCNSAMHITAMACDPCGVAIQGQFQHSQFSRLSSEDLTFLESYILAGFSIKALEERSRLGYVAIRNRLDRVIKSYEQLHSNEAAKHAILKRLEQGELSPDEAAKALEEL